MSHCKSCGREIDWMRTEEGRYIPVDPEPEFVIEGEGDEHFYTEEEGVLTGRLADFVRGRMPYGKVWRKYIWQNL